MTRRCINMFQLRHRAVAHTTTKPPNHQIARTHCYCHGLPNSTRSSHHNVWKEDVVIFQLSNNNINVVELSNLQIPDRCLKSIMSPPLSSKRSPGKRIHYTFTIPLTVHITAAYWTILLCLHLSPGKGKLNNHRQNISRWTHLQVNARSVQCTESVLRTVWYKSLKQRRWQEDAQMCYNGIIESLFSQRRWIIRCCDYHILFCSKATRSVDIIPVLICTQWVTGKRCDALNDLPLQVTTTRPIWPNLQMWSWSQLLCVASPTGRWHKWGRLSQGHVLNKLRQRSVGHH